MSRRNAFLEAFVPFQARVARAGRAQQPRPDAAEADRRPACRTSTRVPSCGTSVWSIPTTGARSITSRIERALEQVEGQLEADPASLPGLMDHWQDGVIKLAVTLKASEAAGGKAGAFRLRRLRGADGAGREVRADLRLRAGP